MLSYYGDTLDAADSKLQEYTDHYESLNNALEHYKTLMSLFGRSKDYRSIDTILRGQSAVAKESYEASKVWLEEIQS
jgi:vacuolar-type H+-ATPase subunit C/Vma6